MRASATEIDFGEILASKDGETKNVLVLPVFSNCEQDIQVSVVLSQRLTALEGTLIQVVKIIFNERGLAGVDLWGPVKGSPSAGSGGESV